MKRKQRILKLSAIVGCILLGAGVLLSGAGFVGMGMKLDAFSHPRGGEAVKVSHFVREDAVEAIEIHAHNGDVKIERASGANQQEVEVVLADEAYLVSLEDGLLLVTPTKSARNTGWGGWNWYQLLNLYPQGDWDVTIRVPEKLLDSVFVESGMGDVELYDVEAQEVTVDSSCGDVTLEDVTGSQYLMVYQSMGRVTLEDCQGGELHLENDMGDTELRACSFTEGEATASAGSLGFADSGFASLTVENDMGDVNLTGAQVEGKLSCQVNMGAIRLEDLNCPDITLSADMGDVSGTIDGRREDYQITIGTDMGDSNLKDQLGPGPKLLQVTTAMGSIDLSFSGD